MALQDSPQYLYCPRLVGPYGAPAGAAVRIIDQSMENNLGRLTATKTCQVAGVKHPAAAVNAALAYCGGLGAPYLEESYSETPDDTLVVIGASVAARQSEVIFTVKVSYDDARAVETLAFNSTSFGMKSFGFDFSAEQITIQRAEEDVQKYTQDHPGGVAAGRIIGVVDGSFKGASVLVPGMTYWEMWRLPSLSGDSGVEDGAPFYGARFEEYYEYYGIPAFDFDRVDPYLLGDDYVPGLCDQILYGSSVPDLRGAESYPIDDPTYYIGGREVIKRAGYDPDTTDEFASLSYAQYLAGFVGCVNAANFHTNYHMGVATWEDDSWAFANYIEIGRETLGARHTWRGFPPYTLRMDAPEIKPAGNNAWTALFRFAYQPSWRYAQEDSDYIIWPNGSSLPRSSSPLEKIGHQFIFWDTTDQSDPTNPSRVNAVTIARMYPEADFSLLGLGWVAPVFGGNVVAT